MTNVEPVVVVVTSGSMEIRWQAESRLALMAFAADTKLSGPDGVIMVDALTSWAGAGGEPFAMLVDAARLNGTDAAYRATTTPFFTNHRKDVFVAVWSVGAVVGIIIDMFRLASGMQIQTFADEGAARAWLRKNGIRA